MPNKSREYKVLCVFITAVIAAQGCEGTAKFNGKFVQFGNKRQKNANNWLTNVIDQNQTPAFPSLCTAKAVKRAVAGMKAVKALPDVQK